MNIEVNLKGEIKKILSEDLVPGGLADDKTISDIANKHGAPRELIELMLQWGVEIEMEHTDDREMAKEIAKDHLMEDPLYYKHLKQMENKYKK